MLQPKISVIVAVYNAEKTLDRLVQSLINQTLTDFEVLLIDDGSTDSSGEICDKFAVQDCRFKAFHKPNQGIGSTRQFGIEHATGEYTIHADSDDWVESDWLEQLHNKAVETGSDMVMCDFLEEKGNRRNYISQKPESLDHDKLVLELLKLHGGPWNKLIRRSTYMNAGIRYVEGLNYGEDKLFNIELALKGISVDYLPKALYHYDVSANPDSAVHSMSLNQILCRENYIAALRAMLPGDIFKDAIDMRQLEVVYYSVLSQVFTKAQFKERFSSLSKVKWNEYRNMGFPIKVIVWTSLHISYRLGVFLGKIKQSVRRVRTGKKKTDL